jgi:hypothetical protein
MAELSTLLWVGFMVLFFSIAIWGLWPKQSPKRAKPRGYSEEETKELHGSTQTEITQTGMPLPEHVPAKAWLEKGGIDTIEELRAVEDLENIKYIGPDRKQDIRRYLNKYYS